MAMESIAARRRLAKYPSVAGGRRAVERASDSAKYAEVFQRIYPRLTDRLS